MPRRRKDAKFFLGKDFFFVFFSLRLGAFARDFFYLQMKNSYYFLSSETERPSLTTAIIIIIKTIGAITHNSILTSCLNNAL